MERGSLSSIHTADSASSSSRSSRQYDASPVSSHSLRRQLPVAIPSYMSYQNGTLAKSTSERQHPAAQLATKPAAPAPVRETIRHGLLLIVVTGRPSKSLLTHVTALLRQGSYATIAIVGDTLYQDALKQLKMDVYATIGRLRQEAAVYIHMRSEWTDDTVDSAIQEAVNQNPNLQAVLAVPLYPHQSRSSKDILDSTPDDLENAWQTSLGLLHTVAKHTLRRFPIQTRRPGLFLVADEAPQSSIGFVSKAACDALITQLAMEYESRNFIIGHAEKVLISAIHPAEIQPDGQIYLPPQGDRFANTDNFALSESPTRLWNMWALQDEIVGVK